LQKNWYLFCNKEEVKPVRIWIEIVLINEQAMEKDIFIKNFAEVFEETEVGIIKPLTKFRDIEEWSSFHALSIIAMVDEKYSVKLTGDDIRNSVTIEDIYNIVNSKI
jgi:acyl carrier protein